MENGRIYSIVGVAAGLTVIGSLAYVTYTLWSLRDELEMVRGLLSDSKKPVAAKPGQAPKKNPFIQGQKLMGTVQGMISATTKTAKDVGEIADGVQSVGGKVAKIVGKFF